MIFEVLKREKLSFVFLLSWIILTVLRQDILFITVINSILTVFTALFIGWEIKDIFLQYKAVKAEKESV